MVDYGTERYDRTHNPIDPRTGLPFGEHGRTDLSKRIVLAWLRANPEPPREKQRQHAEWWLKNQRLGVLLHYEAYESAVLQFLVPEIALVHFSIPREDRLQKFHSYVQNGKWRSEGWGDSRAEALFNAIEATQRPETKP